MENIKFVNGKIYTGKDNFINSFGISDGKFVIKSPGSFDKVKDLNGRCVLPGFIDSHTHITHAGIHKLGLDLKDSKKLDEIFERIDDFINNNERNIYFAYGFDESILKENRFPTKKELDEIVSGRPFYIQRRDQHSLIVNSEFEKKYGISSKDGFVNASTYEKIKIELLKNFQRKDYTRALNIMQKIAFKNGITTLHTMEGAKNYKKPIEYLMKNKDNYKLDFIIYPQILDIDWVVKNGFDKIGGCILLDGSFGSRTAALKEEYSDSSDGKGTLYFKDSELYKFVEKAHLKNLQLSFHAIGDRAIEQILDVYEKVLNKYPKKNHQYRIEHFELATEEMIKKASDLDLQIAYQPVFEYLWNYKNGMYEKRLGKKRMMQTNRYKTALNHNLKFSFGSDCDVTPLNPLLGIYSAVNRFNIKENISVRDAINAFTINSAEMGKSSNLYGSIEEDKMADFIILDEDIFEISKSKIKNIKINEVYKKGKSVFKEDL